MDVQYLGFHLSHGQVHPQNDKTTAIAACPRPKIKKKGVRQFLGLAGYCRRLNSKYSDVTSPLTVLTKKGAPDLVQRRELFQQAITQVKAVLCSGPQFAFPNFSLTLICFADQLIGWGLGAMLSQVVVVGCPMLYIS